MLTIHADSIWQASKKTSISRSRVAAFLAFASPLTAMPTAAQELEALKQQLEEQRRIVDRQQIMLEEQLKVIERLQRLANDQSAAAPKETTPAQANVTTASTAKETPAPAPKETTTVASQYSPPATPVEIYGTLYPLVERIQATNATFPAPLDRPSQLPVAAYTGTDQGSRTRIVLGTSNIGFRGTVDIGAGYKALWQIEAGAAFDGDSASIGNTNVFGLRNSAVGITGPFGTAFFGNWDTPYKWAALSTNILRSGQGFDNNNLINGPLVLRYAYEQHNDYFGMSQIGGSAPSATNTSSKDTGNKIIAQYTFGDTTVSGIYEWLRYSNDDQGPGNVASYRCNGYYILAQQQFGPSRLWVAYGSTTDGRCSTVAGGPCNTSGLGATEWVAGYTYNVNKYLDLYAVFYDIRNRTSGTHEPVTALNVPVNTTPAPGLNIRSFGGGMLLAF